MGDALAGFESLVQPGDLLMLDYEWAGDDAWKDGVMRPRAAGAGHGDSRTARGDVPQYQTEGDRVAAQATLAGGGCASCIWLE